MDNLAQERDQKGGEEFFNDFTDYNYGKAFIDLRYKYLLDFKVEAEKENDELNKQIFKNQLLESFQKITFKRNDFQKIISEAVSLDEMLEVMKSLIEEKTKERALNGDKLCKDIVKLIDETLIFRITSYLTTSFMEIQGILQQTVMKKTRGEEGDKIDAAQKKRISDAVLKINEYKNGLIESKRYNTLILLFGAERISQIYPDINKKPGRTDTKTVIGNKENVLTKIKNLLLRT